MYQQTQRWLKADAFEAMAHNLRAVPRLARRRREHPSAVILDSRTLQSSLESASRAGDDGAKRKWGSKVHMAADTLEHLLALNVTAADVQHRTQVKHLAEQVQEVTEQLVRLAFVDQGYTGDQPAQDAAAHRLQSAVVKLPEAKKGFVLLLRRWVVERSFAWSARFRRLARDYEWLLETLAGLHFLAFVLLMLRHFVNLMAHVS